MVLVTLELNGQKEIQECPDLEAAKGFAEAWSTARRKHYPHGVIIVTFYAAERIAAD